MTVQTMKKIPYGKSNFEDVVMQDMYYVDKTKYIVDLENSSDFFFFIRPRRFGKSLFISMLANYYDLNKKDRFDELFGMLWIGQHPTPQRNKFAVLRFDFSKVSANLLECEQSFNNVCCRCLKSFCYDYGEILPADCISELSLDESAVSNLDCVISACNRVGLSLYVFVDEYDNFTNTMLSGTDAMLNYEGITHQDGFYRTFFAALKSATASCLKKIFITGVSPVTLDDLTSGFNIDFNYTSYATFNEMLGFTETDVRNILDYYRQFYSFNHTTDELVAIIKPWYDNYCFSAKSLKNERLFNSDMVLYFLNAYVGNECEQPSDMLDKNIRIDYNKLLMLVRTDKAMENQVSVIQEIISNGKITASLNENFPAKNVDDRDNFVSLLYYFGLLTIGGTYRNKLLFSIPNQVVRNQMIDFLLKNYDRQHLSYEAERISDLGGNLAYDGDWKSYFTYIADKMRNFSSQRDRQKGEAYVHGFTFALALLNDFYLPISENDTAAGYSDVYMQPRLGNYPDMQHSFIVEFKYVKSSDPDSEVERKRCEAETQIRNYAQTPQVRGTIGHTILHKIVQVYKGTELAVLEEIE